MKINQSNAHPILSYIPMNNVVANASAPSSISAKHDQLTLTHGQCKASNFVHYNSEGKVYTLGEGTNRNREISEDEACSEVEEESGCDIEEESCCDLEEEGCCDIEEESCCDIDDWACDDIEDADLDEVCFEAHE